MSQKKIDLRYHELGSGYFAQLEEAEPSFQILDKKEIFKAIFSAPKDTPASLRSRLVLSKDDISVGWNRARIHNGRIIRFDKFQK